MVILIWEVLRIWECREGFEGQAVSIQRRILVDRNSVVWSFCERKAWEVVKERKKKAEEKSLKSCKCSEYGPK